MKKFKCHDCGRKVKFHDTDIVNDHFEIFTDQDSVQVGWHYLVRGRATRVFVCEDCFDVREGLDYPVLGMQEVLEAYK